MQNWNTWRQNASTYRAQGVWRGILEIGVTVIPFMGLLWAMYWSLHDSYWTTLALAVPTAGFLVRTFILMHDCSHNALFASRRANEIVGFLTGVLTLTPFAQWRRDHALHHASSGDLDRRGHGDIHTLTIEEYRSLSAWGRRKYRLYRHPFILFGLGPFYLAVSQRWRPASNATGSKQSHSVHLTNLFIVALIAVCWFTIGITALLAIYIPVFFLAAAVGIWLFYVQHQFEDTYWESNKEWEYVAAALQGSSYYKLPRVLDWITGSIGLHHVHHVDPKIPNYNLRRCHAENAQFHMATTITLRQSFRTVSLKLWDPEQGRLVGFDAVEYPR